MTWFLLLVFIAPGEPNTERHVTLEMPNKAVCEAMREQFVYGVSIAIDKSDERTKLQVKDKQCLHSGGPTWATSI